MSVEQSRPDTAVSSSMKTWPWILCMALVLVGCGHQSEKDPIDRIVKEDSGASSLFGNGVHTPARLPKTASINEVTSNVLSMYFAPAKADIAILQIRRVYISQGPNADMLVPKGTFNYTAVLANTSYGQKVVLLKYEAEPTNSPLYDPCLPGSWWNEVYDVEKQ